MARGVGTARPMNQATAAIRLALPFPGGHPRATDDSSCYVQPHSKHLESRPGLPVSGSSPLEDSPPRSCGRSSECDLELAPLTPHPTSSFHLLTFKSLFGLSQFQSSVQPVGTHNQLFLVPVAVLHLNQILTFVLIQPKLQGESQYCLPPLYLLSLVCSNWVVSLTQIGNYSEGTGVEKVMSETPLLPQGCTASEGCPSRQSQSVLILTSRLEAPCATLPEHFSKECLLPSLSLGLQLIYLLFQASGPSHSQRKDCEWSWIFQNYLDHCLHFP